MPVLVVEDDRALSGLLEAVLRRRGSDVVQVWRGDLALEAIRERRWDAVVLDLMLPALGGAEILEELRSTDPDLLSRIIVLTAASRAILERFEFEPLVWTLMRKPFDVTEFGIEVRDCVAAHSANPAERPPLSRWLEQRARPLGARAGLVAAASGESLKVEGEFGFAAGLAASFFPLPLQSDYPICAAVRRKAPVLLGSMRAALTEFPALLPLWTLNGGQAVAAIPVAGTSGTVASLGLSFGTSQTFSDSWRESLARVATDAAAFVGAVR